MRDRVKSIMSSVLDVPAHQISDASGPETLESWDSVNHMNLVMALEEEFGARFSEEQIPELLSLSAIVAALEAASSG